MSTIGHNAPSSISTKDDALGVAAAITGSFADFKIIRTRSVCQLVIEVPLEQADAALAALGGVPQPATERPVAVARLVSEKERKPDARERYAQLSEGEQAVARAGLLAADPAFQESVGVTGEDDAADYIRNHCGITTRRSLAVDGGALRRFLVLEARFKSERRFGPHATRYRHPAR